MEESNRSDCNIRVKGRGATGVPPVAYSIWQAGQAIGIASDYKATPHNDKPGVAVPACYREELLSAGLHNDKNGVTSLCSSQ